MVSKCQPLPVSSIQSDSGASSSQETGIGLVVENKHLHLACFITGLVLGSSGPPFISHFHFKSVSSVSALDVVI